MTECEHQEVETRDWDWVIPLVGGSRAILRTPIPLTEENYQILTENLERTLRQVKKAIVRAPCDGERET